MWGYLATFCGHCWEIHPLQPLEDIVLCNLQYSPLNDLPKMSLDPVFSKGRAFTPGRVLENHWFIWNNHMAASKTSKHTCPALVSELWTVYMSGDTFAPEEAEVEMLVWNMPGMRDITNTWFAVTCQRGTWPYWDLHPQFLVAFTRW
jgi:hypothetical protein